MLLASASAAAPAPAQTDFPKGFVNLINALLTPAEQAPSELAQAAPDDSQNTTPESVTVRSSSEIADALIRSMLGSSLSAGNLFSDRRPATVQTEAPKDRQPAEDSQPTAGTQAAMVPPTLLPTALAPAALAPVPAAIAPDASMSSTIMPALMAAAAMPPALTVPSPAPGGASKFRGGTTVPAADSKPAAAQAELAFALRLTPFETPEGNAPVEAPKVAPAAAAPAKAMPITAVPAALPAPAPGVAQVVPAAVDQNQVALAVENSPAPIEPQPQGMDNTPSDTPRLALSEIKPRQESDQKAEATPVVTAVSAAGDSNGNFARPLPNSLPVPAAPHGSDPAQQPVRTAEQALRSAEVAPAASAPKGSAVQEIAVRIAGPDASAVDLHMIERAGQVHVSVRTADTGLQTSLRQDLGTLVNSLERSGYRTEAFTSRDSGTLSTISAQMDARSTGQDAGQNGGGAAQDRASQDGSGQHRSGQNRSGQGESHDSSGGQQQKRRQQHNWIDTLEKTQ